MSGRRRRKRARQPVLDTVTDPMTGEEMQVGGDLFLELTGRNGFFDYDGETNTLHHRVGENFAVVTMINNPSDNRDEQRATPLAIGSGMSAILQGIVRGTSTFDDLRNSAEMANQPFLARNMTRLTWGPHVVGDENGTTVVTQPRDALLRFLERSVLANAPENIPYINAVLNAGEDGLCVQRFLPDIPVQGNTLVVMLEAAYNANMGLTAFDILGGVIAKAKGTEDRVEHRRCVLYQGHVYPLRSGTGPTLMSGPTTTFQVGDDIVSRLEEANSMYFRRNTAIFLAGEDATVLRPEGEVWEEWMAELMNAVPRNDGLDDGVRDLMKASARSLYYVNPDAIPVDGTIVEDPNLNFVTVDMSKCYYHVLLTLLNRGTMIAPDIFCKWRPYVEGEQIEWASYYRTTTDLAHVGISSNILCGDIAGLLQTELPDLQLTHVVDFRMMSIRAMTPALEVLKSWKDDPVRKKKYALINGMFARDVAPCSTWFSLRAEFQDERQYYIDKYKAKEITSNLLYAENHRRIIMSRVNWHVHVVQMANFYVLRTMYQLKKRLGVMPVRIKVDSLMYRRGDVLTPFESADERLLRLLKKPYWNVEKQRPNLRAWPAPSTYMMDPDGPPLNGPLPTYDNITYIGPPGTGKTWTAMNRHKYDIAVCYSNKGARRVSGRTINSAFKLWKNDGIPYHLEHLRDKIIFVDEAQSAGRKFWGMFKEAYERVGARFIFAMDPDQIPPVGELPVHVDSAFLGRVTTLSVDRRNDVDLIHARASVLEGTFSPTLVEKVLDGRLTLLNIAYTNRTCTIVNKVVSSMLGLKFGDSGGRYIARRTDKRTGFAKAELMVKEGDLYITDDGREYEMSLKDARKNLSWAYCTTIHKQIGETFEEDFTIWDIGHPSFDRGLLYTALTRARRLDQITFRPAPRRHCETVAPSDAREAEEGAGAQ